MVFFKNPRKIGTPDPVRTGSITGDPYGGYQDPAASMGFLERWNDLRLNHPDAIMELAAGIAADDIPSAIQGMGQALGKSRLYDEKRWQDRQTKNATYQWLISQGLSEADAQAAMLNPTILSAMLKRQGLEGDQNTFAPVLMVDKDGNYFYASPDPNTGQLDPYSMPEGSQPVDPGLKSEIQARGKERGEFTEKQAQQAPSVVSNSQRTLLQIVDLKRDKAKAWGTGMSSILNAVPGSAGYDFANRTKQVAAGAMTQAIASLHGLGAMSDADREAAMAATNRLTLSTSEAEFDAALADYEYYVQYSMQVAIEKAQAAGIRLNAPYRGPGNVTPDNPEGGWTVEEVP